MKTSNILSVFLIGSIIALSGCSDSASTPKKYTYSVKLTNLTAAQPMAPLLLSSESLYSVGQSASLGLETLAESGDNSALLNEYSVGGNALVKPAENDSVTIETKEQKLSLVSMLVNTNDGFVGLNNYDVSSLDLDSSVTINLSVYDAGTEENSETTESVPGLGGEGMNTTRESADIVRGHSGVISSEDGLSTSGLKAQHKFNNPAASLVITRIK